MPPGRRLTWRDAEEIALELKAAYPEKDPLRVGDHELRQLIVTLPAFADKPAAGTGNQLEAIQAAWYEEREG